jgi:hypothetical protein
MGVNGLTVRAIMHTPLHDEFRGAVKESAAPGKPDFRDLSVDRDGRDYAKCRIAPVAESAVREMIPMNAPCPSIRERGTKH